MNLVNVLDKFLDDKEKEVVLAMLKTDGLNPTNLMTTQSYEKIAEHGLTRYGVCGSPRRTVKIGFGVAIRLQSALKKLAKIGISFSILITIGRKKGFSVDTTENL
jgi:hypothetical protein